MATSSALLCAPRWPVRRKDTHANTSKNTNTNTNADTDTDKATSGFRSWLAALRTLYEIRDREIDKRAAAMTTMIYPR